MFDSFNGTQVLLSIMIILLGVTLVIVGIQLFFVLKDLRKSLARTERILTDMEQVSSRLITEQQYVDEILSSAHKLITSVTSATSSVSSITKFIGPASIGMSFIKSFSSILNKRQQEQDHDR
jgi:uncharacterized protein YoxC